jgi:predicted DsbA family dithiol-disulfide isomerase
LNFELHRVPFFLEPGYFHQGPDFTETHTQRMVRKFGSQAAFDRVIVQQNLPGRGAEVGLDALGFVQENLSKRIQSDTTTSHRLVIFIAKTYGLEMCEAFYKELNIKHFTQAGVLNDRAMLLSVAEAVGCDRAVVSEFLESDKGVKAIRDAADKVHDLGINGIPTLIVNAQLIVNGAARADEVEETLKEVVDKILGGNNEANERVFKELWDGVVVV